MSRPHILDEDLRLRVLKNKHAQGLAWKIERAAQANSESRALVKLLVEKWAELVNVRRYFPDLADVFNPEAVFPITYADKQRRYTDGSQPATQVYMVLAYISNLVARHNTPVEELKRLYNHRVLYWGDLHKLLPLFDDIYEAENERLERFSGECLYVPQALQGVEKKPKRTRTKKAKSVEQQINELEPKFSIGPGGQLIIT
jgi:hypothetical protein